LYKDILSLFSNPSLTFVPKLRRGLKRKRKING